MSKKINSNLLRVTPLPTPWELHEELPSTALQVEFITTARREVAKILHPSDDRLLLIVGPCSIHDLAAAREYALKLRELAKQVEDTFFIVLRTYFEKPRTQLGWKGMLYDPHLDGSNDMAAGLRQIRQFLLELATWGIPAATEFLDPSAAHYYGDLITWGCVGARTSESQVHRQMVSGLPLPVAFKNSTTGCVEVAVNGVLTAYLPHSFMSIDKQGKLCQMHTVGNPHCHIVLRGGESGPNYDPSSINSALEALQKADLPGALVVDCSHDNSQRKHEQQLVVFQSIMHQIQQGEKGIRGVILESHLQPGNQPFEQEQLHYGVSITDPCLEWEATAQLVQWGRKVLASAEINYV